MTKKKSQQQGHSDWATLIAEYEELAGQETHEAFAARKQVDVEKFRYRLYKMRKAKQTRASAPEVRFVEVRAGTSEVSAARCPGGQVEVELGAGRCRVRFDSSVDAQWLGEMVAELAGRLEC